MSHFSSWVQKWRYFVYSVILVLNFIHISTFLYFRIHMVGFQLNFIKFDTMHILVIVPPVFRNCNQLQTFSLLFFLSSLFSLHFATYGDPRIYRFNHPLSPKSETTARSLPGFVIAWSVASSWHQLLRTFA